jgi:dihydroorotate dehydrogenase electron transfer subunit
LPIDIDLMRVARISETVMETSSVKTLVFKDRLGSIASAGQFLMVWIPRIEEIPMSVMVSRREGHAAVTVKKHGIGSTALFEMDVGDFIGLRGPYGNRFTISREFTNVLLIGGGTGLVPLLRLAVNITRLNIRCTLIIGARTKDEVIFEEYARKFLSDSKGKVIVTTDDGSYGMKGTASDGMIKTIGEERYDCVYTCGPELMMNKIFEISKERSLPVQASLERYMKCGIGICGSCCIDRWLVCRDGTVFDSDQLSWMKEFGNVFRDKDGQKMQYE